MPKVKLVDIYSSLFCDQIKIPHNGNIIPSSLDFKITILTAGTLLTGPDQPVKCNVCIRGVPACGQESILEV